MSREPMDPQDMSRLVEKLEDRGHALAAHVFLSYQSDLLWEKFKRISNEESYFDWLKDMIEDMDITDEELDQWNDENLPPDFFDD